VADSAMRERIERAWRESRWALGIGPDDAALEDLLARYAEPQRRYHDLTHLDACLVVLEIHRGGAARVGEVIAALLFHDAVYDPTRRDNEAESAKLARVALAKAGADEAAIARVEAMILATRDHEPRGSSDVALLLDVDLSILGEEPGTFDAFDRAIRAEYAFVPEADYRKGRRAVLEGFLARPRIFHTEALFEERESIARANLSAAIARLG
jgi:predicted metal-dependent HD superfamily phosphohydrolase